MYLSTSHCKCCLILKAFIDFTRVLSFPFENPYFSALFTVYHSALHQTSVYVSTYFSVVPTCIVTKECSRYRGTDQRPKSDMLISSQGTCSILLTHCRNDCSAQEFGSKIFIFNTVWDSGVHIIPGPCANWVNLGNQNLFICRNTLSNILKFS